MLIKSYAISENRDKININKFETKLAVPFTSWYFRCDDDICHAPVMCIKQIYYSGKQLSLIIEIIAING